MSPHDDAPPELPSPELAACQAKCGRCLTVAREIIELDETKFSLADAKRIARTLLLHACDVGLQPWYERRTPPDAR